MRRRGGFTFIEITIVIMIVGLLLAFGTPRMRGTFGRVRLTSAARDITALMRFARDVAVLTESRCEMRFSPNEDAYQLVVFDRNDKRIAVKERRRSRRWEDESNPLVIGADLLERQQLPRRVHFAVIYTAAELTEDTNLPRVIFYPDGSATPATVAIQDDNQKTIRVELYRTTGMTRVEPGLPPEAPPSQKLYYGPGA
jgi:type II secretion system protein H